MCEEVCKYLQRSPIVNRQLKTDRKLCETSSEPSLIACKNSAIITIIIGIIAIIIAIITIIIAIIAIIIAIIIIVAIISMIIDMFTFIIAIIAIIIVIIIAIIFIDIVIIFLFFCAKRMAKLFFQFIVLLFSMSLSPILAPRNPFVRSYSDWNAWKALRTSR